MKKSPSTEPTVQKTGTKPRSFLRALLSGLVVFVLLAGLLEGACRLGWVDKVVPMRSVGNYHTQFETKWFKLDEYVRQNGGVDVILLGNSMVNTGIDPEVLSEKYAELTGQQVRIFNFGVEGLTIEPLSLLARILEEKYHPGTIIIFTEMRDYIAGNGDQVTADFLANAWVQQQLGNPSLEGYLEDNSLALQHLLPFRYWANSDFLDTYLLNSRRLAETTASGYEAARGTEIDVNQEPDPTDPKEAAIFELFKNYTMDAQRIAALESILAYEGEGTRIIVTEMPVFFTYYSYLENESDRVDYLARLQELTLAHGGAYLEMISWQPIHNSGFADNHHLNYMGAETFTNLFAAQLADLCSTQQVCLEQVQP
jgi:hypothetical protein